MSDYIDKMQLHVMGKQLVRDVAKLAADKQATNTAREYAKITAVNGDGTLELDKGTENYPMPISNVRRTVGAEAKVGDVVVVETTQHVPLATSIVSVDGDTDNRITGAIADAQDTADAAQTAADTAKAATDALQTLIRETSDGIEVGKSADGSTYTGTHTLVGTDAFEVHDKDHNTLASFSDSSVELGKNSDNSKIDMINGALVVTTTDDVNVYDAWTSEQVATSIENTKIPEGTGYKYCSSQLNFKTSRQARNPDTTQYVANQYGDATITMDSYEVGNDIQLNLATRVLNDDGSLKTSYNLCNYSMSAYTSDTPHGLSGSILEQANTKTLSLAHKLYINAETLEFQYPATVPNSYKARKSIGMGRLLGFIDALNNNPRKTTINNAASGMYCQAFETPTGIILGANSTGTSFSAQSVVCKVYTTGKFSNTGNIFMRGVFANKQSGIYVAYGSDGHTITITTEQATSLAGQDTFQVFIPCGWSVDTAES